MINYLWIGLVIALLIVLWTLFLIWQDDQETIYVMDEAMCELGVVGIILLFIFALVAWPLILWWGFKK